MITDDSKGPAALLAELQEQYARLSSQADGLVSALQQCREDRDAYAAGMRGEAAARLDAEARLEALGEELDSLGKWVERIRRRTK